MDINTIKIINNKFDFLGEIEDYVSFYFVRNFTKAKEFQLVAPIKYLNILKNENIIFTTPKKAGIIEEVTVDENKKLITVKGRDLKSIVGTKIIVPPFDKSHDAIKATAEEVIKHYVINNCITPADSKRKIEQLEVADNKKRGSLLAWESRLKNLDFELEQICNASGFGWEVYLDLDRKKIVFDVVEGVDRTKEYNSRVIFSEDFDNIINSTYTTNSINYKTMAYIAGQGEGTDRTIREVFKTEDTGIARKELFIDARDINKEENLYDRAKAKLAEHDYIISNESTVLNYNFKYEEDWDLGDIVILKNSLGESSQRVIEINEVYEGYRKIDIVLGSVIPLITETISNQINSIPNNNGPSKMWRPFLDNNGSLTWTLNSSIDIPAAQNIKGPKGNTGETGTQGPPGIQGIGLNFLWNGTQLGIKREDDTSYKYIDLKGQKGDTGIQGKSLEFKWNGTQLGIRIEGQANYSYVNLKGDKGDIGIQGPAGADGKNLEFTWNDTQLGVRQQGQNSYTFVNLKGDKGDNGIQGIKGDKIKHQWDGPILQLENPDGSFDSGVNLKGDKGDQGDIGPQGVQGPAGNGQSYVVFQKYFIAEEGQKTFSWNDGYVYPTGINAIAVYINGTRVGNKAFKEVNGNSIEFLDALNSRDNIFIEAMQAVKDLQGPKGADGKNLEFSWNGTQLGIRQQGQSTYSYVNLKGDKGTKGDTGPTGPKGDTWKPTVDSNGNLSWIINNDTTAPSNVNIKGQKGDTGNIGHQGYSINYKWDNTKLGIKREDESTYTFVDLKGTKGEPGIQGIPGIGLQFNWNGTKLGIRIEGQTNYSYVELKGDKGDKGIQGSTGADGKNLEFSWNGTQLGIRQQGQSTYSYVNLKGDKGTKGDPGPTGPKGDTWKPTIDSNGNLSWVINNDTTAPSNVNIKGQKGDTGKTGSPGKDGKDGTQIIKSATQPTGVPIGTIWI